MKENNLENMKTDINLPTNVVLISFAFGFGIRKRPYFSSSMLLQMFIKN